jgi:predicted RNA-binding protein with PUA-like domain
MQYWLVRSPFKTRKWEDILVKGVFHLYGIRNAQSRKNIARMQPGEQALWYSSTQGKAIYGILEVKTEPFQDPGTSKDWLAIDFIPKTTFAQPITLQQLKANGFENSPIINQPRTSVLELGEEEFKDIISAYYA